MELDIGKRLREIRKRKGLTQKKLAEIGDMDLSYIGKIERGEQLPSIKSLLKIGKALSIPVTSFFEEEEFFLLSLRDIIKAEKSWKKRRQLYMAVKSVYEDDLPLIFEIIELLRKHRAKQEELNTEKGKISSEAIPSIGIAAEGEPGYGLEERKGRLVASIEGLEEMLSKNEKGLSLNEEEKKILIIALEELRRDLEDITHKIYPT